MLLMSTVAFDTDVLVYAIFVIMLLISTVAFDTDVY